MNIMNPVFCTAYFPVACTANRFDIIYQASVQLAVPERVERMRRKGGRDFRKSVAYREALQALQEVP